MCGSFPCIEPKFGSMGKPSPGVDLRVIDNEGNIVPPNTEGDIAVRVKPSRPVGLFKEYWKVPDRTASVYKGDWYLTGDRAYVDDDGYFWFVGRSDDVILTSGLSYRTFRGGKRPDRASRRRGVGRRSPAPTTCAVKW